MFLKLKSFKMSKDLSFHPRLLYRVPFARLPFVSHSIPEDRASVRYRMFHTGRAETMSRVPGLKSLRPASLLYYVYRQKLKIVKTGSLDTILPKSSICEKVIKVT